MPKIKTETMSDEDFLEEIRNLEDEPNKIKLFGVIDDFLEEITISLNKEYKEVNYKYINIDAYTWIERNTENKYFTNPFYAFANAIYIKNIELKAIQKQAHEKQKELSALISRNNQELSKLIK